MAEFRSLIINADDYGRAPSVSAGIRRAHRAGIVTSTTAMMNMPGVAAELQTAMAECPRLGLGVHLVLTADKPVLPAEQVASVTRLGPQGGFPKLEAFFQGLDGLNVAEVRAEWRAQIERFVQVTHRTPTHLDSHHHTSYMSPALFGAMLELASELGCAIRLPVARNPIPARLLGGAEAQFMQRLAQFAPPLLARTSVPHPDDFVVDFYGPSATRENLGRIISSLGEGVTEVMCHPGELDPALASLSSYSVERARELEILTDPALGDALKGEGVQLVSFADLPRREKM